MRVDCRASAAVFVGVLVVLCGVAEAQKENGEARGHLEQVEAASVFSPDEEIVTRRVCLNAGAYVLAAHVVEGGTAAVATIIAEGADSPLAAAGVIIDPQTNPESDKWTWWSFSVDDPACFEVRVLNGRARVYELTVSVSW